MQQTFQMWIDNLWVLTSTTKKAPETNPKKHNKCSQGRKDKWILTIMTYPLIKVHKEVSPPQDFLISNLLKWLKNLFWWILRIFMSKENYDKLHNYTKDKWRQTEMLVQEHNLW
jgi:hypothetical protein